MAEYRGVKKIKLESKETYQRLINKELGSCGIKSGHVILAPGENIGEHTTGEREELIIVLKGKGEMVINRKDMIGFEIEDVLYVPPQTYHDINNTGPDILEYVFVTSKNY